ncbi:MAG: hypothetical protein R3284_02255 [Rubricoccaceae bacterium]|nr:hypothetical protein [Rubricoccaceae bacterium]
MRTAIQVILGVVVIALGYFLYRTITDPWNEHQADQRLTELTRARMDNARTALIRYRDTNENYPSTLDSLVLFVKTDSTLATMDLNEVFAVPGGSFNADSLPFSPRPPHSRFGYELFSDDTTGVTIYYLKDPDSEDHIGAQTPDPAFRNAASWE